MSQTPSLAGRNALVTGGGSGLGFSMAQAFIAAGARVCISGRRESVLADAVVQLGPNATYVIGDVTKADDRLQMVDAVTSKWGAISILVNNAGQSLKKPALEVTDEEFDQLFDTHVKAAFSLTREVARDMIEQGQGSILFIASMASYMGVPQIVGYTAGNDVSSRSIEGENPLYLPQAKIYDGSCAIGPGTPPIRKAEVFHISLTLLSWFEIKYSVPLNLVWIHVFKYF